MDKNYLRPFTEVVEIESLRALCSSDPKGDNIQGTPELAPKRVF